MKYLRSSWNPDRVAACLINKPHATVTPRTSGRFAEFSGTAVRVRTRRGRIIFEHKFENTILSAVIRNGKLIVSVNGHGTYVLKVKAGTEITPENNEPLSQGVASGFVGCSEKAA